MLERLCLQRPWAPDDAQIRCGDPVAEQHQGQRPVMLARDPDQAVRFVAAGVKRLCPKNRPWVLASLRSDQLLSRNPETMQAKAVELEKRKIAPGRQHRKSHGFQPLPPDDFQGAANRNAVKDRFGESAFDPICCIHRRHGIAGSILERMEPAAPEPGIEVSRPEAEIVTAYKGPAARPELDEGVESGRRWVRECSCSGGRVRRQALRLPAPPPPPPSRERKPEDPPASCRRAIHWLQRTTKPDPNPKFCPRAPGSLGPQRAEDSPSHQTENQGHRQSSGR
jgi:hypothetical protein